MHMYRGMTLVELILVVVVLGVLLTVALVRIGGKKGSRRLARQAVCGTRLRGLGTAMGVYAMNYNNAWPSIGSAERYDADPEVYATMDELTEGNADCGLQHYWPLVKEGHCGAEQFSCPGDDSYRKPVYEDVERRIGFDSWSATSYALQPATRHESNRAYPGAEDMDGAVVLAGDKWAPGAQGKTLNHPEDGGNFLRFNYSVTFERFAKDQQGIDRPTFGWEDNDVFHLDVDPNGRPRPRSRQGLPQHVNDSFLYWRE